MRQALICALALGAIGLASCGGGGASRPLPAGWAVLRAMPSGVGESAAAAMDGKVYLAGGFNTRPIFQIYDLASDSWEIGPPLGAGTDNAGAVAAGGKIYLFGGEASPMVQIFDVNSRTWSAGPPLPTTRFSSVVELLDGKVHLVGGWSLDRSNNVSLASHEVFDPATQSYGPGALAPLLTARNHAACGVIGGKLYVTGGRAPGHEDDGANIAKTEVYDPAANAWTQAADMPTPRSGGASAVLGGKLYVLGGGLPGTTMYKTVERFDPATGQWERLDDMPDFATGHRAVAVGNSLYVFGGFDTASGQRLGNGGVSNAWRFTPPN